MEAYPLLFSGFKIKDISLSNRITMAPMYVGYADPDGTVNDLVLNHYRKMAASGAGLIVVENAAVDPTGLTAPFILRVDNDNFSEGLKKIAAVIHDHGALAFLQINHGGRYAYVGNRLAPSSLEFCGATPREMTAGEVAKTVTSFARAALRVKETGFDGVELHGGTGYLLAQFLSPRTNQRTDGYGGPWVHRMRVAMEVLEEVRELVGPRYPVGYRMLADELLPGGFTLEEACAFAREFAGHGIDYFSVMAGTHESFPCEPYVTMEKNEGYMVPYAQAVKEAVPATPVIAAGRIQTPAYAEKVLAEGKADMIGLARVLFADPLWPRKAKGEIAEPIVPCAPACSLCMTRVMAGKKPYCSRWSKAERLAFLARIGETQGEG